MYAYVQSLAFVTFLTNVSPWLHVLGSLAYHAAIRDGLIVKLEGRQDRSVLVLLNQLAKGSNSSARVSKLHRACECRYRFVNSPRADLGISRMEGGHGNLSFAMQVLV